MVLFSIVVPVYNPPIQNFVRCLESLVSQVQLKSGYEIILVDDGSTEPHVKNFIDHYKTTYPKLVSAYSQPNSGISVARNVGIKKSNGKYIVFVDSDDYISPYLLSKLEAEVLKEDLDLIRYQLEIINGSADMEKVFLVPSTNVINGKKALKIWIDGRYRWFMSQIFVAKKELYIKNNLFFLQGHVHEDFGIIPLLMATAKKMKVIDFIGYAYVQTQSSIMYNNSINFELRKLKDFLTQADYLKKRIEEYGLSKSLLDLLLEDIDRNVQKRVDRFLEILKLATLD